MSAHEDVLRAIPHRPPFLFVDEVLEVTSTTARTRRTIRPDEPHFAGHYPGNPIMPGVLLCEAVLQTAAIYLSHQKVSDAARAGTTPVLVRIEDARFKRMVRPGDVLDISVEYLEARGTFHVMRGRITRDGQTVSSLSATMAMLSGDEPQA